MATTVNFNTIDQNIFKNFYDILNAVSGLSDKIYTEFPDVTLDSSASYPIAVLDSPLNPWEKFTFGVDKVVGHIDFNYYTTVPKDRDTISSLVSAAIQSAKGTLAGVKLQKIYTEVTKDMIPHGNIKIFVLTITINYRYTFSSTRGF